MSPPAYCVDRVLAESQVWPTL